MSANKINEGIERYSLGGYNFYTVDYEGRRAVIGGVPEKYAEEYVKTAASCDAVILLSSKPEFNGGLDRLLTDKPDIEVFGGSAALRNIKEILNRSINEKLVKDNMTAYGIRFMIMPNLHWVDTIMAICGDILFSGEAFSGFDGSAVGLKDYYMSRLAQNKAYMRLALDRLMCEKINIICPAYGEICPQGTVCVGAMTDEVFAAFRKWSAEEPHDKKRAAIVYSSEYGYTAALARHAESGLRDDYETKLYDVNAYELLEIAAGVNNADILLVGTHTINRNAPQKIWDVVTRIDLVNKKNMPYFVFGSFGWAGDGIKLIDKTLTAMGLRRGAKAVEVLFKPAQKDFESIDKAVAALKKYGSEF